MEGVPQRVKISCLVSGCTRFFYNREKAAAHEKEHRHLDDVIVCECGGEVLRSCLEEHQADLAHLQHTGQVRRSRSTNYNTDVNVCVCGVSLQGRSEGFRWQHNSCLPMPRDPELAIEPDQDYLIDDVEDDIGVFQDMPFDPVSESFNVALEEENEHSYAAADVIAVECQRQQHKSKWEALPDADILLINALRLAGHHPTDSLMETLYKVINSSKFREALIDGKVSSSFQQARAKERKVFENKNFLRKEVQDTIIYYRPPKGILEDIAGDGALLDHLILDPRIDSFEEDSLLWGTHYTSSTNYARIRSFVKERHGKLTEPLCLSLWTDKGEDANGRSIQLVTLGLQQVPASLQRRADCVQIAGYFHGGGNAVDAMSCIMHEWTKIRNRLVEFRNGPVSLIGKKFQVHISTLIGDHPAMSEVMGTMISASGTIPCKACYIKCTPSKTVEKMKKEKKDMSGVLFLNDPERWEELELRTQQNARERIDRMRLDEKYKQKESGYRNIFAHVTNPVLQYFDYSPIGMFEALDVDPMHDLDLGIIQVIFACVAEKILAFGAQRKIFLSCIKEMSQEYCAGFEGTLYNEEKDWKPDCKTTLLHRMKNKQLYAKDWRMFLPTIVVALACVDIPDVQSLVPSLADLMAFVTCLKCRFWPVGANSSDFYATLKTFGINTYKALQKHPLLKTRLSKELRELKIHEVFSHFVDARRRHMNSIGVDHLEKFFRFSKLIRTNGREHVGNQILPKILAIAEAGRQVLMGGELAEELRRITDANKNVEQSPGIVPHDIALQNFSDNQINRISSALEIHGFALHQARFIKWCKSDTASDDNIVQRGRDKIYGSSQWHGKEKWDFLEVVESDKSDRSDYSNNIFIRVRALLSCGESVFVVGQKLSLTGMRWARMPVLVLTDEMYVSLLSQNHNVVPMRKFPRPLQDSTIFETTVQKVYRPSDQLFVLLTFTSAGSGRCFFFF